MVEIERPPSIGWLNYNVSAPHPMRTFIVKFLGLIPDVGSGTVNHQALRLVTKIWGKNPWQPRGAIREIINPVV